MLNGIKRGNQSVCLKMARNKNAIFSCSTLKNTKKLKTKIPVITKEMMKMK